MLTKKQNEELFAWGQFNSDEFARLDYTVPWEVSEHLPFGNKYPKLREAIKDKVDELQQFVTFSPTGERIEMIRFSDLRQVIKVLFPKAKKEAVPAADRPITEWEIFIRARKEYAEEIGEKIDEILNLLDRDYEKANGLVIKMLGQLMLRELPKLRPNVANLPKQVLDLFPLTSKVTPVLYPASDNKDAEVIRSLSPAAMLAPLAAWAAYQFEEDVDSVQEFGYLTDGTFWSLKKSVEAAIKKERAAAKKAPKGKAKAGAK